jgi:hypothetical protein
MANIKVGKADVKIDFPSHVKGVHEGNSRGSYKRSKGHNKDGTSTARRSTGVKPKRHDAILPIMPNISPG